LAIYRITLAVFAPFVVLAMLLRWLRGQETGRGILERFGLFSATRNRSPVIWVHGASLGEMTAARSLMNQLIAEIDSLKIIATVNTATAHAMIRGWQHPQIAVQMAPLDYTVVIRRFFRKWHPMAMITLENELWPNRILHCQKRDTPVFVVGARMSAQSAARWAKMKVLSSDVMAAISYLAPMDEINGRRFVRLGLPPKRLGKPVNLKVAVNLPDADDEIIAHLTKHFAYSETFLAASTHEGDEEMILAAYSGARSFCPNIKLILAPRHPNRGDLVSQLIEKYNFSYSRRSLDQDPGRNDAVYLADSVGEMSNWYSLASTTIIGGTFSDRGGHTPVEPIQFGSLVVHGSDVSNHLTAFSALEDAGAAIKINTPADLQNVFEDIGKGPETENMKIRAAAAIEKLRRQQADTSEVIAEIKIGMAR